VPTISDEKKNSNTLKERIPQEPGFFLYFAAKVFHNNGHRVQNAFEQERKIHGPQGCMPGKTPHT
jgi:hypothetical protein